MARFESVVAGTLAAVLWASAASAGPMTCKAVVTSPDGGRLEVAKTDPVPTRPGELLVPASAINWYPPSSSGAVNLDVEFNGQNPENPELIDMDVEFPKDKDTVPEQFEMQLSAEGMQTISLEGGGVNIVTHTFIGSFNWTHAADIAMAHAIANGARVKVDVFKSDKVVQPEVFNGTQMNLVVMAPAKLVASAVIDTTAVGARKPLFARARHLIDTSDPSVCKPVS